jgi:hypothetical protein
MSATCSAKENREVPNYTAWLMFFKRFIDDIFGIWLMDPDPVCDQEQENLDLETFKTVMNTWHSLEWIFSDRTMSVSFMDLTISIQSSKLHTTVTPPSIRKNKISTYTCNHTPATPKESRLLVYCPW